ncbi:hypothetical protein C2G38_432203 [Gigaspora rosea]|uniref:Uncharacterized protein n=1 Tax=Gigaspora rosea TaxID=44941 RepID=A0A397VV61_9GLOM|nr:hypothetical protein C2G38_432203 [Gigaspora rosea]
MNKALGRKEHEFFSIAIEGGDRKIAKDWDKERKLGKANASSININNSTISGSGIGTIERRVFTSVSPKKKGTNPRKRTNNATAQRIKKTKTAKGISASDSFTDESQKFDEHGAEEEAGVTRRSELLLLNMIHHKFLLSRQISQLLLRMLI